MSESKDAMWQCQGNNCGYIYNPKKGCKKSGVDKGTSFEELPEDYKCKVCGASKKFFKKLD